MKSSITLSTLSRARWNVVDVITILSNHAIPTYLICDIDMTCAEQLRKHLLTKNGQKVTVTAMLLKAIGVAQREHPASRALWLNFGRIATLENVVAGFTVEKLVDEESAVFFGAIESPDKKSLIDIMSELRRFSESPIDQHPLLSLEQRFSRLPWFFRQLLIHLSLWIPALRLRYLGATFGLSSLGKYGIQTIPAFPVCTSTFGVGVVEDRPVARNGKVEIHSMMNITLGFDQRVMDGVQAAQFLNDVRRLMEGGLEEFSQAEVDC